MIVRKYPDRTIHHRRRPQNAIFNIWGPWLFQRELGCPPTLGLRDRMYKDTYSAILPVSTWDQSSSHGGVFNLEFSPDGRMLVAACERKSVLVFDPLTERLINHLDQAHTDNVNCVRFLDSRMFATGSDDMTVALWDVRYLKHRIRSLRGHSYWVKNIEYASSARLLVTSGFDGSIYTWDINRYTEDVQFTRVFYTDGLMRTKLTPDESKLVICTTTGYMMVVNDLDLVTLASDLQGFNPNMYRLMQLSENPIASGCYFNHVFTAKHNRVELISDFPRGNDAEIISSLQIHPQGWCALSRNTSSDNNSEWTCVHDIQDFGRSETAACSEDDQADDHRHDHRNCRMPNSGFPTEGAIDPAARREGAQVDGGAAPQRLFNRPVIQLRFLPQLHNDGGEGRDGQDRGGQGVAAGSRRLEVQLASPRMLEMLVGRTVEISASAFGGGGGGHLVGIPSSSHHNHSDQNEGDINNRESRLNEDDDDDDVVVDDDEEDDDEDDEDVESSDDQGGRHVRLSDEHPAAFIRAVTRLASRTMLAFSNDPPAFGGDGRPSGSDDNNGGGGNSGGSPAPASGDAAKVRHTHGMKIHKNRRRLTHYAEELNVGRGFIKELCFSTDGRLVCSPYGNGVRLLAFDANCRELCDVAALTVADELTCETHYQRHHFFLPQPSKLHDIATNMCHSNVTVSTKFSPTHCLLVSGCLNGKICFHRPVLS